MNAIILPLTGNRKLVIGRRYVYPAFFWAVFCLTLTAAAFADSRVPIFVSILPQKFFVQKIGGDRVDVQVMVRPGANPATYEPKPRQMAAISRTKIYYAVGLPFEKAWLEKISASNREMKIVHTDDGIEKILMMTHQHHPEAKRHRHEKAENQRRGIPDPHIWLSPPLVKIQARHILRALEEVDPAHRAAYQSNYRKFLRDVDALDTELRVIFAGEKGLRFMIFHPSWGYFALAYGIEQVPIEIEGKTPGPAQLKELIAHAKEYDIKVIFAQPQFSAKSAGLIAREIDGQVVFADPLAPDWENNLREVAAKFKKALR